MVYQKHLRIYFVKSIGFSDDKIAELTNTDVNLVKKQREQLDVFPVFKKIDTCAANLNQKLLICTLLIKN